MVEQDPYGAEIVISSRIETAAVEAAAEAVETAQAVEAAEATEAAETLVEALAAKIGGRTTWMIYARTAKRLVAKFMGNVRSEVKDATGRKKKLNT